MKLGWFNIIIFTLIFYMTAGCSSPPSEFAIKGQILQDRYTPAVTTVSLSLGDADEVPLKALTTPALKTETDAMGKFKFTLTHDQIYFENKLRAMAIFARVQAKNVYVYFHPDGSLTNLGSVTLWDNNPSNWLQGSNIIFQWDPLYKSTGFSSSQTTFFLYCGPTGENCWKQTVKDSGSFSLPLKIVLKSPICWELSTQSSISNRIYLFSSNRKCINIPNTYPNVATSCRITINNNNASILKDGKATTVFGGSGLTEINFQCNPPVKFSSVGLYNFTWTKNREEYTNTVEIGIMGDNNQLLATGKITGKFGLIELPTPIELSSFTLTILTPDIFFTTAGEVKLIE